MKRSGQGTGIFKATAIMTAFSLAAKLLGVLLRLYLSSRVGSEGMGLYQLVMSVYGLFGALSTAGLTVAVSRLAAEKAVRSLSDASRVLGAAEGIALGIGAVSAAVLWLSAPLLSFRFLRDERCVLPLRILALSLPCMALAACFKGWFIAKKQVLRSSSASLFEQCVKFAVMAWFLGVKLGGTNDVGALCKGIVWGVTLGEFCSFVYLLLAYRFLAGRVRRADFMPTETRSEAAGQVARVVLPIGASVAVTSVLHTVESLLIPIAFERFGGDRANALSEFGVIRGMVLPLLFFPFAILSSFVSVTIPEISRLHSPETHTLRAERIGETLRTTFLLAIPAGALFFFLAPELGETFYPHQNTAHALRVLASVTPLMYVQTVCDGLLKATDGQKYTLRYGLYNSLFRVSAVLLLLPRSGAEGYLALLVASNTLEFALCFRRLRKNTGFLLSARHDLLFPLVSSVLGGIASRIAAASLPRVLPAFASPLLCAVTGTAVFCAVYILMLCPTFNTCRAASSRS